MAAELSRDGKKLAFSGNRAGKWELWEKSLVDGREAPIVADDYSRYVPQWSPDGRVLHTFADMPNRREPAYDVVQPEPQRRATHDAQRTYREVYDWSPDGKWLLISQGNSDTSPGRNLAAACRPPALMRKHRHERLFPTRPTISISRTSLPTADGLSLKPCRTSPTPVRIHTLCNACGRRTVDSHHGRQALGRQASLVSRWKDDLLRFWPWRLLQRVGNPLRCESRESQWENHSV